MTDQATRTSDVPVVPDQTLTQTLAIVRDVLSSPGLGPDDDVMDHGGTSLSLVRILTEVQQKLGVAVNPLDLDGVVSATSLARAAG